MALTLIFSTVRFLCVFANQCSLGLLCLKIAHNFVNHIDILKNFLLDSINPTSHVCKYGKCFALTSGLLVFQY